VSDDKPAVIFLHGLARTRVSMERLRWTVAKAGWQTWSCTYPSRDRSVEDLAEEVAGWIREALPDQKLIAVTHSMGGILARHMPLTWERVLMLAPPNQGSAMASAVSSWPPYKALYGPAGQQMAAPGGWPIPDAPTAVIAGTGGLSPTNPVSWLSAALKVFPPDVDHDGTVSVEEARLPGITGFATVPASHTWIMEHPRTRELTLRFLETGEL
jgi:triacylglycerol lipase